MKGGDKFLRPGDKMGAVVKTVLPEELKQYADMPPGPQSRELRAKGYEKVTQITDNNHLVRRWVHKDELGAQSDAEAKKRQKNPSRK